jgi:hypothetical protein
MSRWTHVVVLSLLVSATVAMLSIKRTDVPIINCDGANSGVNDYKILIVGESWASDGRIFPELPRFASARLDGRGVTACSIGFSGRNSRLLYHELVEKFPRSRIRGLFGGAEPDKLLLMTGVNDTIQHIGAANYVEYTKKLVDYFEGVDDIQLISIPRVNERTFKPPSLYSAIKRNILRCFYDGCDYQVNDVYRIALWRDHPELRMIEYDDFIDEFREHEHCHTPDGIHLTGEYYHKYGTFLGVTMSVRKDRHTQIVGR